MLDRISSLINKLIGVSLTKTWGKEKWLWKGYMPKTENIRQKETNIILFQTVLKDLILNNRFRHK
jgi:hypothetical protein